MSNPRSLLAVLAGLSLAVAPTAGLAQSQSQSQSQAKNKSNKNKSNKNKSNKNKGQENGESADTNGGQGQAQGTPMRAAGIPRGLIIAGAVSAGLAGAAIASKGSNGRPASR